MRRLLLALLLVAGATVVVRGAVPCSAIHLQPACYVALHPGPVEDTVDLVEVTGTTAYAPSGELLLTTVLVEDDLDLLEWLQASMSQRVRSVPRESIYPPELEEGQVDQQNAALMQGSQLEATVAALRQAGYEFDEDFDGAEVHEVLEVSAVDAGQLQVGDVIVGFDGEPVRDNRDVVDAVTARDPGDTVRLDIVRDGEERQVELTLIENPGAPGEPLIGVLVLSHLELPVDIGIDAGAIGGPSAGLMFALSIVELLGPEDLTGGAVVAGTGTIDRDGNVGAIGGIVQKVVAAADGSDDRSPASVFLVPRGNVEAARTAPVEGEVLLVPVDTLDDALAALADLRAGRQPAEAFALPAG